ncbi:MAG: hypothetical protein Q8R10_19900 [Pseudomonas sp.]|uniref:hypothetical protein n=1 Tax=Pseudomonas sp. TaxID=306 RepID=UPI002735435B|nr:hypothetical protein [Pseudomonas sp.]MDP3848688.1 hypothetical protein [Pseudomonas sp.]
MHKPAGYNSPKGDANNAEQNQPQAQANPAPGGNSATVTALPAVHKVASAVELK